LRFNNRLCIRARALLDQPTPQPVAVAPYREVADLVVWLEDHSAECLEIDQPEWSKSIKQAARFLHLYLRATPQPVADALTAPTLLERAMAGDATAARRFLHEAGFTDKQGQWLPQYQPIPEALDD
jgi:hypothetical protein